MPDMGQLAIMITAIGLFSLLMLVVALHQERRWRLIRDLPTCRPGGTFVGLVEVLGTIHCEAPLTSHLSETPCTWYRWSVEEHWSRTVHESSVDAQGHVHTSTREESGWRTVASGGEEAAFTLEDETGSILVRPGGARVESIRSMDETCNQNATLYYLKGPATAIGDSDFRRRFYESVLPVMSSCYVIGQARQTPDLSALEIALDQHAPLFVISLAGQRSVARGYFWSGLCAKIGGLLLAIGGSALLGSMCAGNAVLWSLGAAILYGGCCLVGWCWLVHNSLIELRQRVHQGWSNVDVQLKRRFDLIAQLMPLVQGISGHESLTHPLVAALRCQQQATPPGAAGPDFSAVSSKFGTLVESYPNLIADAQFNRLHQALIDCEDRIALARNYFNDIATSWNVRLQRFPDVLVARMAGMKIQQLMHFDGALLPAPAVAL